MGGFSRSPIRQAGPIDTLKIPAGWSAKLYEPRDGQFSVRAISPYSTFRIVSKNLNDNWQITVYFNHRKPIFKVVSATGSNSSNDELPGARVEVEVRTEKCGDENETPFGTGIM